MRRRFRSRRRRTMWFAANWSYVINNQPSDYCYYFGGILPPAQMFTLAPHGYVIQRVLLDYFPVCQISGGGPQSGTQILDLFLTCEDATDDNGVTILASGSDVLKPFVQATVGSANIGGSRSYMWTKRMIWNYNQVAAGGTFNGYGPLVQTAPLLNTANFLTLQGFHPPSGGNPYLDLRVKRRVAPGQALVFGVHLPNGLNSEFSLLDYVAMRTLVSF